MSGLQQVLRFDDPGSPARTRKRAHRGAYDRAYALELAAWSQLAAGLLDVMRALVLLRPEGIIG